MQRPIAEAQTAIRQIDREIASIDQKIAMEAAEEVKKNSWKAWMLSPIYGRKVDSEEEKERKSRTLQERKIMRDMKERRLVLKKADLKMHEAALKYDMGIVDAAERCDDEKIRRLRDRIREKEEREKQERERVERERLAKLWKQWQEQHEKLEREAAEAFRKQRAEEQAAEQKRAEERRKKWQRESVQQQREFTERAKQAKEQRQREVVRQQRQTQKACYHQGWWPKMEGRAACPECDDVWNYLLQCPNCDMMACPKCQHNLRPKGRW